LRSFTAKFLKQQIAAKDLKEIKEKQADEN